MATTTGNGSEDAIDQQGERPSPEAGANANGLVRCHRVPFRIVAKQSFRRFVRVPFGTRSKWPFSALRRRGGGLASRPVFSIQYYRTMQRHKDGQTPRGWGVRELTTLAKDLGIAIEVDHH